MIRKLVVAGAVAAMVLPVTPAQAAVTAADGCTEQLLADLGGDSVFPRPDPIVERDPVTGAITIYPNRVQPAADEYAGYAVGNVNFLLYVTAKYADCIT